MTLPNSSHPKDIAAEPPQPPERTEYVAPKLEPLGMWSALTLFQTIPIGPDVVPIDIWGVQ